MPNLPPGSSAIIVIRGSNPPPGNNFTHTIPPNVRWKPIAFHYLFHTDSNVADRVHELRFERAGDSIYTSRMTTVTPAGPDPLIQWEAGSGIENGTGSTRLNCSFTPHIHLSGGDTIELSVDNIQAGDTLRIIQLIIEQWIEL